ncbi:MULTISPECIES: glutathione transferase [unclassified Duganella]|uniref:glutathione transferase n=1 Tax=unclassified Duganella TaxID=2636909 RepID=UPI000E3407BC|nr:MULTISPECIES: glutathione transferase [unclassified Duganella]RFP12867.1 glutathione transferase [Duganella sp. BJB475]RFP28876.1 glutathione transferase [Duganella sp. BJB476]
MPFELYVDSLFTSPYAMSAFVALTEKGLPFTVKTVDLEAGQQKQSAYTARALTARVPALVEGDFVLTESTAITEYLEESFPAPEYIALYPKDRRQRAQARQIQAWLRSDLLPVRAERDTETVFFGKASQPLTAAGQAAAGKLIHAASQLVQEGRPNLFDTWSLADVDLTLMLNRLILNGDEVPQKLKDYAAGQWQRPSIQQWLERHQPG